MVGQGSSSFTHAAFRFDDNQQSEAIDLAIPSFCPHGRRVARDRYHRHVVCDVSSKTVHASCVVGDTSKKNPRKSARNSVINCIGLQWNIADTFASKSQEVICHTPDAASIIGWGVRP